ncbi:CRE-UGT-60 protein [Aphelenchoides avenae]|nr:CRE-UGT-60 protein [Aphelenchus avenae]
MVAAGDLRLPPNVTELRVPIHFKDALKVEGLKVFQTMMFNKGSAFDLWWTGQEFKDMRLEACEQMLTTDDSPLREELFDVAIGHFHDLCPLPMARKAGVKEVIWITHGTSVYDYTAVQIGLRTFPSFVPHPLSSYGDRMSFDDRLINLFWHLSTLDFVNLPQNLLHDENTMFQQSQLQNINLNVPHNRLEFSAISTENLWQMSQQVRVLLVNGERFLDFPRPLPTGITFMGEVGKKSSGTELPLKAQKHRGSC